MVLKAMSRPLSLLLAVVGVVFANQLEDIPHNEVKNWALKFGVDLWEFGRHFTKMNQIQNKYHEYNVEVARKDGLLLVRELAAEVKNHMDFKINAVMRIMDSAEAAALSAGGTSDGSPGSYYDARWLNVHADDGTLAARARRLLLSPSRHFDHIAVNTSYSAVLMPPYINTEGSEVQHQIAWSEHLDPLFVNNYEIDPTLSWQYYASSTGFMRRYPAMSWPPEDGFSHHARDFYDFRSSNWFVEAATSPKDLVILLDDSDDLGSSYWRLAKATVSGLLDTLGPNDFVNVYRYSDTVSEINSCYTKMLAQAIPETVRDLKTSLWNAEASGGVANLTGALITGFEILQRYNRTGQGCQCNQAIAVVGAGGGASGVKAVFRSWNWPHMPVRIFTYRVGGDAASGHTMKDMACTNKGFYVSINEHSEIRPKVLHLVEVLARPLVMYQTLHPVHWSPVYVGGKSSSLANDGMGQLMTSVTVPIYDRRNHTQREANLLGVVGTDVPVDQIRKLVPPYKLGVNGYSFMVDNNGHVLYHPDLRPLHTNEEYTETLRPLYSSIDLTDVELLVDADENSRVNVTSLLLDLRHDMIEQREGETEIGVKVQYDAMRRVATRRQRYFYSPVDGTPYSLAAVLPDGYGMYELQAEQEVKHSLINVTEYFKGENWKIHPDWVYCEYASTSDQTFNSAEEQLLHFLSRAGRPGWKWMSLRPRALTLHNAHKKQDRDAYYCDKTLVQSLIRDAMVIKELDAHTGHASHHSHPIATLMALLTRQGRFHKFVVSLSFIATRSGFLKWTEYGNTSRTSDSAEPHFSEKYTRAFDSEWYRRAVEHHSIEPESFVFSVPFRDGSEADDLSGRPPLVLATHAVFVASKGHRAPAAVVGLHFQLESLAQHFLNVTSTCTAGSICKKTCAGDELDCYILDDNGFIILSEDVTQTGRFFGQVDGTIMDSLVQDRIYKKITVNDNQGRCPDSKNPFSGGVNKLTPMRPLAWLGGYVTQLLAVWFPLWESVRARAHAYVDEDIADYEDYETDSGLGNDEEIDRDRGTYEIILDGKSSSNSDGGGEEPPQGGNGGGFSTVREPPREAARSAAVRPCVTSAELFTLQSTRLNAAQPLKGKLTNCHNSGCERPFSVQKIPHSNLILLVVDTLCPCGAKRLDVRAREAPPRACRRAAARHRRRPPVCLSYHPEEIEIQSCGRGGRIQPLLALVTALVLRLCVT
ncbi:voltage-dependent calcium channel subunit alpha-2/delta-3 isoform X1 [Plodia interpunctella]|uniref:voltage-dependent calcium channel subunit alpha-2/delta-3 isoform X1 n=1 Tax=Plodia interpunctella TaxID=58824 RepID=UPI002367AFF4|nr:voltage-dependent calcium channel subunit alpha-2/delta-3 isoform X1 [Plodia interpunctella]